jgi:hypothetical protein
MVKIRRDICKNTPVGRYSRGTLQQRRKLDSVQKFQRISDRTRENFHWISRLHLHIVRFTKISFKSSKAAAPDFFVEIIYRLLQYMVKIRRDICKNTPVGRYSRGTLQQRRKLDSVQKFQRISDRTRENFHWISRLHLHIVRFTKISFKSFFGNNY